MTKHIFRTKSISEFISETKQDGGMNRVLGTFGLTMLGIGAIVGTGILPLPIIPVLHLSFLSSSQLWLAAVPPCVMLNLPPWFPLPAVPILTAMSPSVNFGPGSSAGT